MSKRCFFITGVECGCNHIVTRLFVDAGCEGEWRIHQDFAPYLYGKAKAGEVFKTDGDVVFNQPTGGRDYDLADVCKKFQEAGYEVKWIIPVRDERYVSASRILKGVAKNAQGIEDIRRNYRHIQKHRHACSCDTWQFSVKMIYNNIDDFRKEVKERYNLIIPEKVREYIYDGDAKYKESIND